MQSKIKLTDNILLFFFIVASIVTFLFQLKYVDSQSNPLVIILSNFLFFFFSVGFGWIFQKINTIKDFQENLKKYAYSAYRRINDIETSVSKVKEWAVKFWRINSHEKVNEFDLILSMMENIEITVNSSKADWLSIIGEDLEKQDELIKKLTIKDHLTKNENEETEQRIKELNEEIAKLRTELPSFLRNYSHNTSNLRLYETFEQHSRLSEDFSKVLNIFYHEVKETSCFRININCDNQIDIQKLQKPYIIKFAQLEKYIKGFVFDKNESLIGELINPYIEISNNIFIDALITILGTITKKSDSISNYVETDELFILDQVEIYKEDSIGSKNLILHIFASEHDFAGG